MLRRRQLIFYLSVAESNQLIGSDTLQIAGKLILKDSGRSLGVEGLRGGVVKEVGVGISSISTV